MPRFPVCIDASLVVALVTSNIQYLALAELMKAEFWTADERLCNAVRKEFPHIRWLGDYE